MNNVMRKSVTAIHDAIFTFIQSNEILNPILSEISHAVIRHARELKVQNAFNEINFVRGDLFTA